MTNNIAQLLTYIALIFPAFLMVFTFRGFFRALAARWSGDDTAYNEGFLTLNPLAHVDLYGMMTVLLLLFFIGGIFPGPAMRPLLFAVLVIFGVRWSVPVPIDESNFKNYKYGVISTALAGPCGCFVVAFVSLFGIALAYKAGLSVPAMRTITEMCGAIAHLGLFWGVVDLLPLPPFDGARLLQFIIPESRHEILGWLEEYALFIFALLFFVPVVSDYFFIFINGITQGALQAMLMVINLIVGLP